MWCYAYAHKHNGQFVLRIEDTDSKRSRKDTEEAIYEILKQFGIHWDEGPDVGGPYAPYRQSERLTLYQDAAHKLVEKGYAYYDFDAVVREKEEIKASYKDEEKREELKSRPHARNENTSDALRRIESGEKYVVRVKMPENRSFEYDDWILKKKIKIDGKEVSDLILLKSDGFPTYHLAVVVDDVAMKISHIFRGQEWISTTPVHLFLYEGLGYEVPHIGHFSVIIDPRTNKKFSKRDLTSMFGVKTWLEKGYLPEALLNYLMLLGWAPKDNREMFTLEEFVEYFDQDGVQKANPVFNEVKLEWFNGQYIRKLSDDELTTKLMDFYKNRYPYEIVKKVSPLIKDRMRKLTDFESLAGYIFEKRNAIKITENADTHISDAIQALEHIEIWNVENLNTSLMDVVTKKGYHTGNFFMDIRGAIAGSKVTPPMNETLVIMGKDETLARLRNAI